MDFLVDFGAPPTGSRADQYFGMLLGLEHALGRHVDLAEVGAITNAYVLRTVEATKRPVYVAA